MVRASFIRATVFVAFAPVREVIFRDIAQVQFAIEMLMQGTSTWFASVTR